MMTKNKKCQSCANQGNINICVCCQYNSHFKAKPRKYRNRPTLYKGVKYDSAKEANWAMILDMGRLAEDPAQRVACWFRQVSFKFSCGAKMIVDFVVLYCDGHFEIHEVKGGNATKTQAYRLKKRMLKDEYGLEVREI